MPFVFGSTRKSFKNPVANVLTIIINGVNTFIRTSMIPEYFMAILSALMVAIVFGDTSPKIRIIKVNPPVAIPAPTLPHHSIAREVAREDADKLTILLPIKIALNILPESSVILSTRSACLFPSSAKVLIRIRFAVTRAVSAEEKKADRAIRIINAIIWTMSLVSNFYSPHLKNNNNYPASYDAG